LWLEQFIIEKTVASKIAANKWKGLLRGGSRPFINEANGAALSRDIPVYQMRTIIEPKDYMKMKNQCSEDIGMNQSLKISN